MRTIQLLAINKEKGLFMKIVRKAKRVYFKFNVEFENIDIPNFFGERMITIPGQPQKDDITKEVEKYVLEAMQNHLSENKVPADCDLKASLSLEVLCIQGVEMHVDVTQPRR